MSAWREAASASQGVSSDGRTAAFTGKSGMGTGVIVCNLGRISGGWYTGIGGMTGTWIGSYFGITGILIGLNSGIRGIGGGT
jgi:hypothetical protein